MSRSTSRCCHPYLGSSRCSRTRGNHTGNESRAKATFCTTFPARLCMQIIFYVVCTATITLRAKISSSYSLHDFTASGTSLLVQNICTQNRHGLFLICTCAVFFPFFCKSEIAVPATVRSARSGLPIPTLTPAARAAQNTRAHVPLVLLAGAEHPLVRIIELDPKTRVAAQSASGEGGRRARRSARAHCRAARACKWARAGQETAPAQRGALGSRLHAGAPHLSHSLLLASPSPHQAQRAHRAVAITSST